MDPNTQPPLYFYDSQGNLTPGIMSKPNTLNMSGAMSSGYSMPVGGGVYATSVPADPSIPSTTDPTSSDVMTLKIHCSIMDVVIVVGRNNWQCYMCDQIHNFDVSIDSHIASKHHSTVSAAVSASVPQGGVNSNTFPQLQPQTHTQGLRTFQGSDASSANQYTSGGFAHVGHQIIPASLPASDVETPPTLPTLTTVSQAMPLPPEQTAGVSNPVTQAVHNIPASQPEAKTIGRSGLEREVALLMAQTFTQSGELAVMWDSKQQQTAQSVSSASGNKGFQRSDEGNQVLAEMASVNRAAQTVQTTGPAESTGTDITNKHPILDKMLNKVEKAIPSVADTNVKNGLFIVATELARMKKQSKTKQQILREKYRYITCQECGKEVRNRKSYIAQHNRSHVKGKNYHCLVCNKMFKYQSTLRRHIKDQKHEGGMQEDLDSVSSALSISHSGKQKVQIPQSQDRSTSQGSFDHYVSTTGSIHIVDSVSTDSAFHAENANKNSTSEPSLEPGVYDHIDQFIPPGFPAYEKILSGLLVKGEQARSSTGKKLSLVQCFVCDREIRNRNYYITRHARCHMQDVVYTCTVCSTQFFRRDHFKQHLLQHHESLVLGDGESIDSKEGILESSADTKEGILTEHVGHQIVLDEIRNLSPSVSNAALTLSLDAAVTALAGSSNPSTSSTFAPSSKSDSLPAPKAGTVPCKICGKKIANKFHSIKRHVQQHSMQELESVLSRQAPSADLPAESHPALRVMGSPTSPQVKFRCHICGKHFKSYVKKRRHVMEHGTTFTCTLCWKKFENYTLYRAHQTSCHKPVQTSDHTFFRKAVVRRLKKEKRQKFTCPQCGAQIINTKQSIERHMRELHSEGQLHTCSTCGRAYSSYHKLQRHAKSHGDKGGICDVCGKVFLTRQALRSHTKLHSGPEGMYQCPFCPKSFRFQGLLDRHMRKHKEEAETCPHCGKVYISKVHLQRHISVIHLGVKNYRFRCDECGAQFFESIQLRDHVAYHHQGIQMYTCKFCNKGFNCRPTMVRHERKVHTGYLPYVCTHCNQGFAEKSKLIAHEMTHTGMSPHKCDVCGKYFTTGSALKTHKNLHLGIKPFICSICGRSYIKRWHLQQHVRKSHNTVGVWQDVTHPPNLQPDDQLVLQPSDESLSLHQADGQLTLHQADGQLTIQQSADGQITVHQGGAQITVHHQEGQLTLQQTDGHLTLHQPETQLMPQQPETQLVHQPNAQLVVQETDGHLSVHESLEHITVQHPNIVYH